MAPITFRDSRVVYYGPHSCDNCGQNIVKMGQQFGGSSFNQPDGPIYPNTVWHPHVCDPRNVQKRIGGAAEAATKILFPASNAFKVGELGWIILGEQLPSDPKSPLLNHMLVISTHQCYHDTPESAWEGAIDRQHRSLPTWHISIDENTPNRHFSDDLERLPQCPA